MNNTFLTKQIKYTKFISIIGWGGVPFQFVSSCMLLWMIPQEDPPAWRSESRDESREGPRMLSFVEVFLPLEFVHLVDNRF